MVKMSQPIVTVLVCCYSGERFFDETVASVVSQNFEGARICFHDNGSGKAYAEKIAATAHRLGAKLIRTDVNRYGEGVRFDALHHIDTKYVATIHDDDLFLPGKLAAGIEVLELGGLDFVFGDRVYIDEAGDRFLPATEEVNVKEFEKGDYPYVFVAEIFFRGLRFHYSTLIMRTELAQSVVYGDPYLPRIADCLFVARLLLDRRLRGAATPSKLSAIRVHGANDMLYSKFSSQQRAREFTLLSNSELYIFQEILHVADCEQLASLFSIFPGIPIVQEESRVSLLIRAALQLALWSRSKKMMAASCVHSAFKLDALSTMALLRELSGSDGNSFMRTLYSEYVAEEVQAVLSVVPPVPPLVDLPFGMPLKFCEREADGWLVRGFSDVEPWGRWTDGLLSTMQFAVGEADHDFEVELLPHGIFDTPHTLPSFTISVNGEAPWPATFVKGALFTIPVSAGVVRESGSLTIDISTLAPKRPCDEPLGDDRLLGVGFATLTARLCDKRGPQTPVVASKVAIIERARTPPAFLAGGVSSDKNYQNGRELPDATSGRTVPMVYRLGDWVNLAGSDPDGGALDGFSEAEGWGRWTDGPLARISFGLPAATKFFGVELDVVSVFSSMVGQRLGVRIGHGTWREYEVEEGASITHVANAKDHASASGEPICVELRIAHPKRPEDAPAHDVRALGIGLRRARLV